MKLGEQDEVVLITSAGCNALDYALDGPRSVHAVDMNYRQNALLELKIAGIRRLDFEQFFNVFGDGGHPDFPKWYRDHLRAELSPLSQTYWDKRTHFSKDNAGLRDGAGRSDRSPEPCGRHHADGQDRRFHGVAD